MAKKIIKNKNLIEHVSEKKPVVKIRLDYRTVVTVKDKSHLKMWIKRFPKAKIITN